MSYLINCKFSFYFCLNVDFNIEFQLSNVKSIFRDDQTRRNIVFQQNLNKYNYNIYIFEKSNYLTNNLKLISKSSFLLNVLNVRRDFKLNDVNDIVVRRFKRIVEYFEFRFRSRFRKRF